MPHTRAMGDGSFELRLRAAEGIARVFYCTIVGRKIVMLHQFIKKSDKTPPRVLSIARQRMKEVKDAHRDDAKSAYREASAIDSIMIFVRDERKEVLRSYIFPRSDFEEAS